MKLHLINAPVLEIPGVNNQDLAQAIYPPLGLLYLAAYIRKEIPEMIIKVTDGLLKGYQQTLKEIAGFQPDIVGISATTPNSTGGYQLSSFIKSQSPKTIVVMGGVHPTSLPEEALVKSKCDLVIRGEGEKVLAEVIKTLKPRKAQTRPYFSRIKGIAYLDNQKLVSNSLMPLIVNLDQIPFPARDLIDLNDYTGWLVSQKRPDTNIASTRGCPYNCHFCANQVWKLQSPFLRLRSPKNVMDEVESIVRNFGIKEYFDYADEINCDPEWATSLCQEKIDRRIDIPWKSMIRADKMDNNLARLLAKSNCWYVNLGVESGNQETLDGVGKRITLEQVIKCCKLLKKQKIKICGLFMLFNAWEKNNCLEYEDIEKTKATLNFAKKLLNNELIDRINCFQTTPYPGSCLYNTALKYNLIASEYRGRWEKWNQSLSFVMRLPKVDLKEQLKLKKWSLLFESWHNLKSGYLPWGDFPQLLLKGRKLLGRMINKD